MLPKRKVQRLLYKLYAYYSIFIGATSYRYDFALRQYKSTRWTQFIAGFANICVIICIPIDLYYAWFRIFELDMVTDLTVRLDTTINDVICLLRVLQRLPREKATNAIWQQLRHMQRFYRYKRSNWETSEELEQQLEHIYLIKNCILWLLLAFLMAFMWLTFPEIGLQFESRILERLLIVGYVLALDGQDMTMHLHFMLTWRICHMFICLNKRIRQLSTMSTLELHQLRWQHWQLTRLMQRLNVAYNIILISSRLALIVTAAALGYYISVFRMHNQLNHQIMGFGLYALIALDCYILDLMYDLTMRCHRETSWLLRSNNELHYEDNHLTRGCELLALQIACFPLKFKPYGLYDSGKATWLSNIVCILSWMIVLVQYRMVSKSKE